MAEFLPEDEVTAVCSECVYYVDDDVPRCYLVKHRLKKSHIEPISGTRRWEHRSDGIISFTSQDRPPCEWMNSEGTCEGFEQKNISQEALKEIQ